MALVTGWSSDGLERTPEWIGGCFSKLQSLAELSHVRHRTADGSLTERSAFADFANDLRSGLVCRIC
jgi:hypothetical protein